MSASAGSAAHQQGVGAFMPQEKAAPQRAQADADCSDSRRFATAVPAWHVAFRMMGILGHWVGMHRVLQIGLEIRDAGVHFRTNAASADNANIGLTMTMLGPLFRVRRSPFATAFDELFESLARPGARSAAPTRAIPVEVTERSGEYVVAADLPGYRKEEIAVEMDGARVTITAAAGSDRPADDSARVLYSERVTGKAVRALELGSEIDRERATARYADGVLTLTLPKKVSETRKLLAVQ